MEQAVNPFQNFNSSNLNINSIPPKRNKNLPNIIAISVLIIGLIISFFVLSKPKKTEESKLIPTITSEPSPTSFPKIDKKTVKIQVKNGTGTPGQAGLVVKALTDAGYAVENIKTDNADEFDNDTTSITTKEKFDEIVKDIKDSLKSTFDKITVGSPNLGSTSEFDVVIVTGGKIYETVTPTKSVEATATPTLTSTP